MLMSNKKTAIAFVVVQIAGMMLLVSSDTAEVKMEDIFVLRPWTLHVCVICVPEPKLRLGSQPPNEKVGFGDSWICRILSL